MKKLLSIIVVAALSATVLAACGNDSSNKTADSSASTSGDVKEITVNAKNFAFDPAEIKVKKGEKIKLTLKNAEGAHGLEIPDYNVDLQKDGGSAEFVADKAGTFEFHCSVMCGAGHSDMKGQLIVE